MALRPVQRSVPYRVGMSVYDLGRRRRRGAVRPSPLFLAFVAATVVGGWLAWTNTGMGDRLGDFGVFVFVLGGWVVSVCFHEFAHAFAAYRAGDRGVEARGYLTLNPFKYTHPVLSILLPLLFIVQGGIGLPGGAVYLHPHMFRSRAARSIASAVGPLVNLVLAVALLVLAKNQLAQPSVHARFWCAVAFLGFLQLTAAVLNLLPIPGLDGWGIIEPYLAPQTAQAGEKIKPWGLFGLLIVLLAFSEVNNAFFDLVNRLAELTGAQQGMWELGHLLFKWWSKTPV